MNNPGRDDHAALLSAARRGDPDAFGALYRLHARFVQAIVLARVPPDAADDLVQDVFVLAMAKLHQLRDDAAFLGWLATLARHRAADWRRRRRDTVALDEVHEHELSRDATSEATAADARAAIDAIRALPEAYRETLLLRLVSELSGDEIAARTGLTPGSVRVNLHRGLTLLRERLREGMRDD